MMLANEVTGVILGAPSRLRPTNCGSSAFIRHLPRASAPRWCGRGPSTRGAAQRNLGDGALPAQRLGADARRLAPTSRQKAESFSIGVRTFDPVRVGFLTDVPGFPRFNVDNPDGTPILGNSNAGHEFGANLSDVERVNFSSI